MLFTAAYPQRLFSYLLGKMKKGVALFLAVFGSFTICYGQTGQEALRKYQAAAAAFATVSYSVQRVDTFPDGSVWNHQGRGIMQRDAKSQLLKARFLGTRLDVHRSFLYDGKVGFDLDDSTKTYQVEQDPYLPGVLGGPGGQMLVEELFTIDPSYQEVTYSRSAQGPVITLHYPDRPKIDVRNRYTYLVLDEKTGLPKVVKTKEQKTGGTRVVMKTLSNLRVNNPADASTLNSTTFLSAYTAAASATPIARPTLLNKQAPAFRLTSFDKKPVALSSYLGKVVLLDMWTTSCSPCIASMPAIQRLQEKYRQQGLAVVGVLMDPGNAARAQGILKRQGAAYLNVSGDEATEKAYQVNEYPRYLLVDKQGKVVLDITGGGQDELIESAVKKAL